MADQLKNIDGVAVKERSAEPLKNDLEAHQYGGESCKHSNEEIIFVADTKQDYLEWKNSIENYLVHSKRIQDLYHFHQTLGEGTFGQVLLGIHKQVIPFVSNRDTEEEKNLSSSAKPGSGR